MNNQHAPGRRLHRGQGSTIGARTGAAGCHGVAEAMRRPNPGAEAKGSPTAWRSPQAGVLRARPAARTGVALPRLAGRDGS